MSSQAVAAPLPVIAAVGAGSSGVEPSGGPTSVVKVDEEQVQTFRSFFQTYNRISEFCFNTCVWDFGTNGASLRQREERCLTRCTSHYLQMTKEIGNSFTEGQSQALLSPGSDSA